MYFTPDIEACSFPLAKYGVCCVACTLVLFVRVDIIVQGTGRFDV